MTAHPWFEPALLAATAFIVYLIVARRRTGRHPLGSMCVFPSRLARHALVSAEVPFDAPAFDAWDAWCVMHRVTVNTRECPRSSLAMVLAWCAYNGGGAELVCVRGEPMSVRNWSRDRAMR